MASKTANPVMVKPSCTLVSKLSNCSSVLTLSSKLGSFFASVKRCSFVVDSNDVKYA